MNIWNNNQQENNDGYGEEDTFFSEENNHEDNGTQENNDYNENYLDDDSNENPLENTENEEQDGNDSNEESEEFIDKSKLSVKEQRKLMADDPRAIRGNNSYVFIGDIHPRGLEFPKTKKKWAPSDIYLSHRFFYWLNGFTDEQIEQFLKFVNIPNCVDATDIQRKLLSPVPCEPCIDKCREIIVLSRVGDQKSTFEVIKLVETWSKEKGTMNEVLRMMRNLVQWYSIDGSGNFQMLLHRKDDSSLDLAQKVMRGGENISDEGLDFLDFVEDTLARWPEDKVK